ncbi:hypothetical protein ACFOOM_15530 [Streptomyces echinoruber]|nr:hypothetical protein [Streptomyces echinoruber]
MAREGARPVLDPAGHDEELRLALQELHTGRWLAMRELLARTTARWQWTRRTQILAAAAAGTDVVRAWLAEEPAGRTARVMHARVAVERALRARRGRHRRTHELWIEAWDASRTATRAAPADPVPWICLLALAQLDTGQRWEEHRAPAPDPALPPGPWELLAEATARDPHNREAHHRMLQFLYMRADAGRPVEAARYARRVAEGAPSGSPLHLLPLYVRAEHPCRDAARQWAEPEAVEEAERAWRGWFVPGRPEERSLPDLNHLAHALWRTGRPGRAVRVFDALGPYYTPRPWVHRAAAPAGRARAVEVFLRARADCRSAGHDADAGRS